MTGELIKPNWHVVLVHYPIALVTVGFLAEIAGALFRRPGLRLSARWMIGIGALSGLPAAILGLYAFRDVVAPGPIDTHATWSEVVATSGWTRPMYDAMTWHIWLNSASTVLLVVVAVTWIASSAESRARAYAPLLATTFIALSLMVVGAWFGGELVYGYGAGVLAEPGAGMRALGEPEWLWRFFPPLQAHLLGAGLLAALTVLAIAESLRFWRVAEVHRFHARARGEEHGDPLSFEEQREESFRTEEARIELARGSAPRLDLTAPRPSSGSVRGLWAATAILGIGVVAGGLWSMLGSLAREPLEGFIASLGEDPRVLTHLVVGACLVLLPLIPLAAPRILARRPAASGLLVLVLTLLLGGQVYTGSLMLFDGHHGPLLGFSDEPPPSSPPAPDPIEEELEPGRPVEAGAPREGGGD